MTRDYRWFGETFQRVTTEVTHTGEVTTPCALLHADHVQFIGVEVKRIAEIPEGLVAWELREGHLDNCGVPPVRWRGKPRSPGNGGVAPRGGR